MSEPAAKPLAERACEGPLPGPSETIAGGREGSKAAEVVAPRERLFLRVGHLLEDSPLPAPPGRGMNVWFPSERLEADGPKSTLC